MLIYNENDLQACIISEGNNARIRAVMEKALRGEDITIACFGGSISEGALSGSYDTSYAALILKWWNEAFPTSSATHLNAAISATGSAVGIYRIEEELLEKKPDLTIIEFAVNDTLEVNGTNQLETYENVVRRTLEAGSAVMLLMFPREERDDVADSHIKLGAHYKLPTLGIIELVEGQIDAGRITWRDFSPDNVHPNREGHKLIADAVTHYLNKVKNAECDSETPIPEPMISDFYRDTATYTNKTIKPSAYGAFEEKSTFARFPDGWVSEGPGEPMVFEIEACRALQIMFHMGTSPDLGRATITVEDGERTVTHTLNSHDPTLWGNFACPYGIYRSETPRDVRVTVRCESGLFSLLRLCIAR